MLISHKWHFFLALSKKSGIFAPVIESMPWDYVFRVGNYRHNNGVKRALFLGISIPLMEHRQLANKPGYAEYKKQTRLLI